MVLLVEFPTRSQHGSGDPSQAQETAWPSTVDAIVLQDSLPAKGIGELTGLRAGQDPMLLWTKSNL